MIRVKKVQPDQGEEVPEETPRTRRKKTAAAVQEEIAIHEQIPD